jgi:hypothetical protein
MYMLCTADGCVKGKSRNSFYCLRGERPIVHGRIEYEGRSRDDLANNELVHKLYMGL